MSEGDRHRPVALSRARWSRNPRDRRLTGAAGVRPDSWGPGRSARATDSGPQMTSEADELITPHLPAIWRLARVLTTSSAEAEDLVQDAFLAAWQRRTDLRDPGAARAWLLRITVNEHRDGLRRRTAGRRAAERAAREPASAVGRTVAEEGDSPAALGELERVAAAAMAALPARQREVLHLAAVEGLDHAAIANILGLTRGNVRSTLAIARERVGAEIDAARGVDAAAAAPARAGGRR